MNGQGDQLLSGAAFPQDHNRQVRLSDLPYGVKQLLHLVIPPQDSSKSLFSFRRIHVAQLRNVFNDKITKKIVMVSKGNCAEQQDHISDLIINDQLRGCPYL